ncbi:MAG: HAMP domain-containing protein, partial [Sedimentisphaerales bacterium]|nr:HAMP domain-containing protein [Sedimentisphaerales bacterium]
MKQFYNSLIFKLVFVFLIAAIIPLSMSAVLFYVQEVSIVEKREMRYGQKVLELTAREIDDEIDEYFRRIILLAQQYSIVNDEIGIDDKLREFRLVTEYCEYVDDINLLDLEGNVLCSLNYNYQGSWASKSWYQLAVAGRVSISPVHLQPVTQKSIIAVNVPVLGKNKKVKSVISANLDLEGILKDIFVKEDNDSSYFMLVDNEGKIISHPDIDYVLDAYPNERVSDLFENYASGNVSFYSPDNDSELNNCHMMTIKNSSDLADLGWKLAIVREASDVNQTNATIFIHIAGIFVTGLIFVIIISLASARIIIRPIIEITSVADQIAEGDFNVSIDNDSADEIGDLCRSINQMALKLQTATTSKNELAGEVAYYEQLERQLKNARNKAENANRAKDELLACVSHEVRTPLNAIIGYTESLIMDNAVPAYSVKLKTILNESEHLLCLLNDILDNAKIQSGKFDIDLQPCNLFNAIESVTQLVKPKAVQKGLKLNLTISEDMPCYVITDSLRIRQVILNLLTNAVKFTNNGFVELKLDLLAFDGEKAKLKFSVTDSGIGISKDKQMVIFESYTQADSSTSRKYGGTGLGTTISKNIIDLMGGTMG